MIDGINQREMGKFPISVATSLALEGLFGIHDSIPVTGQPPVTECDVVVINVKTLLRNVLGSCPKEMSDAMTVDAAVFYILDEILTIKNIFDIETKHRVKAMFYIPSYKYMNIKFPKATLKEPTTPKQIAASKFEEDCIKMLLSRQGEIYAPYMITDLDVTLENNPRTFMITHLAVDLLCCKGVKSLALLESHTGIVKYSNQWYTKLKNGKDLYRIPFDKMSIQFFGDSGGMFQPFESKMRKVMLETAEKNQWTQVTTKNKILNDLMRDYEPVLAAIIAGLY